MASVHITLPSIEEQRKSEYVFPIELLEGLVVKTEQKVFTANNAKLDVPAATSSANGYSSDDCRLVLRPLEKGDYDKGYLDLLKQLTEIGEITPERFEERFALMQKHPKLPAAYYVCILEDLDTKRVVGSASLTLEWKIIRNLGIRGRIEDVVVDKSYRGKNLAKILLNFLVELAKEVDVYKLSLECKDPLVPFYTQFGFIKEPNQNYMSQRFIE